jgi:hypothetical protein
MRRLSAATSLLVLAVLSLTLCGAPGAAGPAGKAQQQPPIRGEELIAALARDWDFSGYEDPKTSLIEALDQLSKIHNLTIDVNEAAFAAEEFRDVLKTFICETSPIAPQRQTTLAGVLRKVLSRMPNRSGATLLIRPGHIEITTQAAAREEVWGKDYKGPTLALVHVSARKMPLDKLLAGLATWGERSIVVDPRIGERVAEMPISAQMLNTPLDAALALVCDMADLSFVQLDNTFYVTTPERKEKVKAAWQERRAQGLAGKLPAAAQVKKKGDAGKAEPRKK